jgi:BarA-like signal transduction histidine kinase
MATYVQPSATAAHVEQQIVVKVGDAVIARAAVSGMPRQFTLQGV